MSRKKSRRQEKAEFGQEMNRLAVKLSAACSISDDFPSTPQEHWQLYRRVTSVLEEFLLMQKPKTVPPVRSEEESQALLDQFAGWLGRHKADLGCLKIGKVDIGDRGLIANDKLETSDLALTIPTKIMMSKFSALTTPLCHLIRNDKICQKLPNISLALHVLNEKFKRDSFWKPYIQTLPESYHTPLYYTEEEMKLLEGSSAFHDAIICVRNIALHYSYFFQRIKEFPNLPLNCDTFTYDEYRWAVSTVMTRQNSIPLMNEGGQRERSLALVPFWDMINHRQGGQISTDFDDSNDCLKCYAMWPCKPDSQFMMYYGDRSSTDFLINSAFVPENNDHDRFKLKLGISKADKLVEKRKAVFESCGIPPNLSGTFYLTRPPRPLPYDTTLFLRVFCMNEAELDCCSTEQARSDPMKLRQSLIDSSSPWSLDLHKRLWSFLNTRCQLLLRQYPSSDEADSRVLDDAASSLPTRLIMQLRKSERRLLNELIAYAQVKLEHLESS